MRIVFAGTPDFAAESLKTLIACDHSICAVYTQPDRPAGRGRKLTASPVKQVALDHGLIVEQPVNFKSDESLTTLASYQADLMIVVAYGLLLPQQVLDIPKLACINIHASLLPRWRGAAPIQRAILAGDKETGIGIMKMEAGLDTGPVLVEAKCPITEDDTAQTLHDRLANLGASTLLNNIDNIENLLKLATPQNEELSCYAKKLEKKEAQIDWSKPAAAIRRQINAFNPWPIAQTSWQNEVLRIWQATGSNFQAGMAQPGDVVAADKSGIHIATGEGVLCLTTVQMPGKKAMSTRDFLNSNSINPGNHFG